MIQSAFLQIDSKADEFEVLRIMRSLAKRTPADRSIETLTENVESLMQTRDTQETQNVFDKVKDMIENMIASKRRRQQQSKPRRHIVKRNKVKPRQNWMSSVVRRIP